MNEIKGLLNVWVYNNRRLIIPEFGAFLRDERTDNLVFSSFLRYNDGLLEKIIASHKNISSSEAKDTIRNFVSEMKNTLNESGRYEITNFGYFLNENGDIRFIHTEEVSKPSIQTPIDISCNENPAFGEELSQKDFNRKANTRKVLFSILLSLFILGVLLFLFQRGNYNSINVTQTEVVAKTTPEISVKGTDTLVKKEMEIIATPNLDNKLKYHVIGGCFSEKMNAERFVQFCIGKGYKDAQIISKIGDLYPVSIGKYDNIQEADKEKDTYSEKSEEDAWIFRSN